jgi:hypothetical protein
MNDVKFHRITGVLAFFRRPVFYGIETQLDVGRSPKNAVMLCAVHHLQNPLESRCKASYTFREVSGIILNERLPFSSQVSIKIFMSIWKLVQLIVIINYG